MRRFVSRKKNVLQLERKGSPKVQYPKATKKVRQSEMYIKIMVPSSAITDSPSQASGLLGVPSV